MSSGCPRSPPTGPYCACFASSNVYGHATSLPVTVDELLPLVEKLTANGTPVTAHSGFTPQSEHQLGGCRVQGRDEAADKHSF